MRVAPDNPGGQIARHEGLAVNNIAGTGTSAPPPDQIVLAPRPLDITDEDVPAADLAVASDDQNDREEVALAALRQEVEAEDPAPVLNDIANADDPIKALADQIAADAQPFTEVDPAPDTDVFDDAAEEQEVSSTAQIIPASVPGVARSLRPAKRPVNLKEISLSATSPVVPSGVSERSPDDIPTGTRLVQFGAYDSPEIAREQWGKLQARFGEYLDDKERVIEEASSGGRTFYRLRAHGFSDLSDSRRFCAAIVAEGADCIPVVSR